MSTKQKTAIVTGASQGIGAAIANLFLDRGYNVVGTSRHISTKNELKRSDHLALVDGDDERADRPVFIVMNVAAADSYRVDPDLHILRTDFGW